MSRIARAAANDRDDTPGRGVGISNIHNRIRLYYGHAYGVEIGSKATSGTVTTIRLPVDSKKQQVLERKD
jgi:two-component system sensor histidine kinase YesM